MASLRAKLTAAFLGIMVLFSLATLVSDRGFEKLRGNLEEIHTVTLPRVLALQEVSIRSPEILQLAASLSEVRDGDSLRQIELALTEERARLAEAVSKCGKATPSFDATLTGMDRNLTALLAAQGTKIVKGEVAAAASEELMEGVADMAVQLDADRILLDDSDEESETYTEVIRGLQVELLGVISFYRAIRDADTLESLATYGPGLDLSRRSTVRLMLKLPPGVRAERAKAMRSLLRDRSDPRSLVALQTSYLTQVADVKERIREGKALNDRLLASAASMAAGARAATELSNREAVAKAEGARRSARVYWLSALILSVLILGFYVRGRVVRRLDQLVADLTRLSQGDLSVKVRGGGDAELAAIADAADVFRQNALELGEIMAALELKNHTLTEFTHVASHDLKSPMRAIANLAEWVQEDSGDELGEESRSHLALMKDRIEKMETLLEDLIRYSRLGNDERLVEPIQLAEVVEDVVDLLGLAPEVQVLTENLHMTVKTVPVPLKLCLRNLIQNAVSHSDQESPMIEISARVIPEGARSGQPGNPSVLECVVTDNGPGIPTHLREEAQRMFRKLGHTSPGTGMGLALVKRAAELMGGSIEIADATPRGTRISFRWPVPPGPSTQSRSPAAGTPVYFEGSTTTLQ